ncbi:MAG: hypothetical protein LBK01_02615 [Burkholderiaceae bacterium]|jgi:methyl-accepting chemotaxis protein|nr:hypothetical protein [Burkholderiaceae bacterium]
MNIPMSDIPPLHLGFFGIVLGLLALDFLFRFIFPACRVWRQLATLIRHISALPASPDPPVRPLFTGMGILEMLWKEYEESLHKQDTPDGQQTRRATLPASACFRSELVVDMPLRADFFKHLPGIFTGVGIIGTFSGLLLGLYTFQVSENPVVVRTSLNQLLHGVSIAFVVSAVAITLAMAVTFVEKWLINQLHSKVEKLALLLDALFVSGVEEEYLARLVKASESSAAHLRALQEIFIAEFRHLTVTQTDRQVGAITQLSGEIGSRMENALQGPLADIAETVRNARQDQEQAVQSMLTELLGLFGQRLHELQGEQISGINHAQQQTVLLLQVAAEKLEHLIVRMESAGEKSATAVSEQLTTTLSGADSRQNILNEKMRDFIGQIADITARSHETAQTHLQTGINSMTTQMQSTLAILAGHIRSAAEGSTQHHAALTHETRKTMDHLGEQVRLLADEVGRSATDMKQVVSAMQHTTDETASKMRDGADALHAATAHFAQSGSHISTITEKAASLTDHFSRSANSITKATQALDRILATHSTVHDAMTGLTRELQQVMAQLRQGESFNHDLHTRMENATSRLIDAQREADNYLKRVSRIIEEAHLAFANGMAKTVGSVNGEFQQTLSGAIELLRVGIQELNASVEEIALVKQSWYPDDGKQAV